MVYDEHWALERAIEAATKAQCQKSQRGVLLWIRETGEYVNGFNSPPSPLFCTGTALCRENCNKLAVHAEQSAIITAGIFGLFGLAYENLYNLEMLHVKVVNGQAVASGEPSCWQCSRLILEAKISYMWLLHESGLQRYSAYDFHRLTLEHCQLSE